MRVEVDRKLLETVLDIASAVAPKKATYILPNIHLIASTKEQVAKTTDLTSYLNYSVVYESWLTFRATDLTSFLSYTIPADVVISGEVLLNAHKFKDTIQALTGDVITLVLKTASDTSYLEVFDNQYKFKLYTVHGGFEEFPEPKVVEKIDASLLKTAIENLGDFVLREKDGFNPLSCIYIDDKNVVASDGVRLCFYPHNLAISQPMMLPYTSFKILLNLLEEFSEVSIGSDDSFIHFLGENGQSRFSLSVRKVEGEYPDYLSVIPEDFNTKLVVSIASLYDAVKKVASIGSTKATPVAINIASHYLGIKASDPEFGEAETLVEVEDFLGKEFVIGFNSQYLLEILNLFRKHSDTVEISFVDNESPVVFKSGDITCVLMPMRL